MLGPILCYALLVLPAMAQFINPPEVYSVENSASYNGTIAPGKRQPFCPPASRPAKPV